MEKRLYIAIIKLSIARNPDPYISSYLKIEEHILTFVPLYLGLLNVFASPRMSSKSNSYSSIERFNDLCAYLTCDQSKTREVLIRDRDKGGIWSTLNWSN